MIQLKEKGHHVAGRVVNEKGEPIQGVEVSAGTNQYPNKLGSSVYTKADGRFEFDSIPIDMAFDFYVKGFAYDRKIPLAMDQDRDVTVPLKEQGAIAGLVVDADTGEPVPKFTIQVRGISS
jgi:hypothetical protein